MTMATELSLAFEEQRATVRRCHSTNKDIELAYHTFGEAGNPCILLVSGLGVQCLSYDELFCAMLAKEGFFVVRYDNRDVGLSTKFDHAKQPNVLHLLVRSSLVPFGSVPYTLADMALDGIALLDYLDIRRAHVVGTSMGGMLAQTMVISHPDRFASLTSIMSHTGSPRHVTSGTTKTKLLILSSPKSTSREDLLQFRKHVVSVLGGPIAEHHVQWTSQRSERTVARTTYRAGGFRHTVAISQAPDREPMLRKCSTPALIIHGLADELVPPQNGYRTAAVIPNAKLVLVPDMAHVVFPCFYDLLTSEIVAHARRSAQQQS